jgi:hypothetical protein
MSAVPKAISDPSSAVGVPNVDDNVQVEVHALEVDVASDFRPRKQLRREIPGDDTRRWAPGFGCDVVVRPRTRRRCACRRGHA